jgi:hypothetical protein
MRGNLWIVILIVSLLANVYFWCCAMEGYQYITRWSHEPWGMVYEVRVMEEYCEYEYEVR